MKDIIKRFVLTAVIMSLAAIGFTGCSGSEEKSGNEQSEAVSSVSSSDNSVDESVDESVAESVGTVEEHPVDDTFVMAGGNLESGVKYTLYASGQLVFEGSGEIEHFSISSDSRDDVVSVEIKSGITKIGEAAFAHFENMTSVMIPDSVEVIGNDAFSGCKSLNDISIPKSITKIGMNVFADCTGIKNVTIPVSVTYIGSYAFLDWTEDQTVTFEGLYTAPEGWDELWYEGSRAKLVWNA